MATPSYDELNDLLDQAGKLLDQSAARVRDLDLDPSANIRRLGEAVMLAFEVRLAIFALRPDLQPDYLKKP
jgi:hypothetical protein